MLSYGLNGSTNGLDMNKVTEECYVLVGLYPCSEPVIGKGLAYHTWVYGLGPTLDLQ